MRSKLKLTGLYLFLGAAIAWAYHYDFAFNPSLLSAEQDSSRLYLSAEGEILRLTTNREDQFRIWVALDEYPTELIQALLHLEDRHFYAHFGVNPLSILSAFYEKLLHGKKMRGASTLTMQLARVAYSLRTQSLGGKLQQMAYAIWLELCLSKEDILLSYLNLAPMGRNIQGMATAATIYFGRALKQLSRQEQLLLVSLPQNPALLNFKRASMPPQYHQNRAQRLYHSFFQQQSPYSFSDLLLNSIEELPFRAGHLIDELEANRSQSDPNIIKTHLNFSVQKKFSRVIDFYLKNRKSEGIKNAVVMLVDWVDNKVLAYHGSADFFNKKIQGQVNGTLMMRSPGSTLKPFAYALGIDQGLIHPELTVHDAPGMYKLPQNYDRKFLGPITVTRALNESRNVPAVVLSAQLENPSFYQFLKNTGVGNLNPPEFYGHTLVLGSKEMAMQQVMKYYLALARGGQFKEFHRFENDFVASEGVQVFSPEAAVLIKDMLGKTARPIFQNSSYQKFSDDVYWKTGTSWGYRDAWTFGIQGRYVLGVWVGNFNSQVSERFVGIQSAAPLFFQLLNSLPRRERKQKSLWHRYATHLYQAKVCSVSGQLPNKHCPHHKTAMLVEGVSPTKKCETHRPVLIAKKTGLRSCLEESTEQVRKVYEFWPSHVQKLYEQVGLFLQGPPAYSALCRKKNHAGKGIIPRIIYPKKSEPFILSRSENRGQFALSASAEVGVKKLFWYSNQNFLGSSRPQEPLQVSLGAGAYAITVVDELGRSSSKQVQVVYSDEN